jgi:hypothetical protein
MNYLRANIFWKNLLKNSLPKATGRRKEKAFKTSGPIKTEKSLFLKLLGVLAAIIAAAVLYSLIAI